MVDGLPVGMQIIGRRYADADVLAASAAFEGTPAVGGPLPGVCRTAAVTFARMSRVYELSTSQNIENTLYRGDVIEEELQALAADAVASGPSSREFDKLPAPRCALNPPPCLVEKSCWPAAAIPSHEECTVGPTYWPAMASPERMLSSDR